MKRGRGPSEVVNLLRGWIKAKSERFGSNCRSQKGADMTIESAETPFHEPSGLFTARWWLRDHIQGAYYPYHDAIRTAVWMLALGAPIYTLAVLIYPAPTLLPCLLLAGTLSSVVGPDPSKGHFVERLFERISVPGATWYLMGCLPEDISLLMQYLSG